MKKILFTGGGSAGHVIPNLALIEELLSEGETDVSYMGTGGIEKRLIEEWDIPFHEIECPKLIRGKSWSAFKRNLHIPAEFHRAKKQALADLQKIKPDVVFSKGGYVALPVVFAAHSLGIPCFAHESDFSVGLANRLAAKKCRYVFTSFPETAEHIRNGKYSGAPMRKSLFSVSRKAARKQFGFTEKEKVLLIFGGGSGSAAINEAVRKNIKAITEKYSVLHVCGKGNIVKSNVKNYVQTEFIADMGMAYACADAVISRAGAGTVFELIALKKPALLIPLSSQTRGDQKQNAEYFRRKGLCHVLSQDNLEDIVREIHLLFEDEALKSKLAECFPLCGNENILRELRKALKG